VSDITPEKTHALLEKLAEYVMDKIPTIEKKFDQKANKSDFAGLAQRADEIQQHIKENKQKLNIIIDGLDAQAKQLDIIRTEQAATNAALLRHEKRISALEEKDTGYRVKDKAQKRVDLNE